MEEIINDILSPDITLAGAIFKLLLGLLLGAAIGLERRRKGQIAGLRTFALISMGATLAMLISIYIPQEYLGLKNGDPGRIAAQVISGVGFLGAGAIIQMKGSVRGLTTAAGIWMAACIGLAVGAGMFIIAIVATLLIIFILVTIESIEFKANFLWELKIIRLEARGIVDDFDKCRGIMMAHGVRPSDEFVKYDYATRTTVINFMVRTKKNTDVVALFKDLHDAVDTISVSLTNEMKT